MTNLKRRLMPINVCLGVLAIASLIAVYAYFKTKNEKLEAQLLAQTKGAKKQAEAYQYTLKQYHLIESINTMLLENNNQGAIDLMQKLDKRFTRIDFDRILTRFVNNLKADSTAADSLNQAILGLQKNLMLSNIALNRSREKTKIEKNYLDSLENKLITTVLYANNQALQNNKLRDEIEKVKSSYGRLVFKTEDGRDVVYYGEIVNNKAEGYGIGVFDGKSIYDGEWKNNFRHGTGKYKWKNDDVYEGDYIYGKRDGFGKYTFATGEKYEGRWKDDLRDGNGKLYDKYNKLLVEGKWKADKYLRNTDAKKAVERR